MIDIALDPITNDLCIKNNDLCIVEGAERVRQQLFIKLRLWTKTWFLDPEFGTPYMDNVLGKQIGVNTAIAMIKKSILEVEGVQSITRFDYVFDRALRTLKIDFDVYSRYGIITYAN
jgi:hypothetical protein